MPVVAVAVAAAGAGSRAGSVAPAGSAWYVVSDVPALLVLLPLPLRPTTVLAPSVVLPLSVELS